MDLKCNRDGAVASLTLNRPRATQVPPGWPCLTYHAALAGGPIVVP